MDLTPMDSSSNHLKSDGLATMSPAMFRRTWEGMFAGLQMVFISRHINDVSLPRFEENYILFRIKQVPGS
jgi:hypothetical protein